MINYFRNLFTRKSKLTGTLTSIDVRYLVGGGRSVARVTFDIESPHVMINSRPGEKVTVIVDKGKENGA